MTFGRIGLLGAALTLLGVLAGGATGCATPPLPSGGDDGAAVGRRSEAVVVDYYKGSKKIRSCAGTLLSSNVVLAPAHCADGTSKAVASILDSKRTRTSVSRVYTYDWASADPSMVRSQRHDIALLVLRKPVAKARFAKIQASPCPSCKVVQVGRGRDGASRVLSISKRVRLAKTGAGGTAFRIPVTASRVTKRGGAVYRVTKKDERVIVGLVVGHGKKSGAGVVVPLTGATMQRWIRAVIATEGNAALDSTKATGTRSLRILAEDEETGGSDQAAAEPQSEPEAEKVEDERPQEEQNADPAPETDANAENGGASEPIVEQPASEEQPEPSSEEKPADEQPASDGSPSEPSGAEDKPAGDEPADTAASPEEKEEPNPGTPDDPVVPTGDTKEEPTSSPDREAASEENATPASPDKNAFEDAQAVAKGDAEEPAKPEDAKPTEGDAQGAGDTDPSKLRAGNDTAPPYPGTIPGVGSLRAPARDEETTHHPAGNSVTVASPGDKAFSDDAQLAERYKGVANVYNSHGAPGQLIGGVPADTVRKFLADDKPLIVASCFSGAPMSGGSTIRRMVSAYGDDPSAASRVYGCTGYATGDEGSGIGCSGTWVDGNGRAVARDERSRLGLSHKRCSTNTVDDQGEVDIRGCPTVAD